MNQELWGIVIGFRDKGIQITDKEVNDICKYCIRKMEVAGVARKEEYLPLLFEDEIRNYLTSTLINAATIMAMETKEMLAHV